MTKSRRAVLAAFSLLALSCQPGDAQQADLISQLRAEIERMQGTVTQQQATIDSLLALPSADPELGARVDSLRSVLSAERAQHAALVDSLESVVADLREANDILPGEPPDTLVGETGDPPVPGQWPNNEPEDFFEITHIDGTSKDWPGWRPFGSWGDSNRVRVVVDPEAKYGFAVEKRFMEGDVSGWGDPQTGAFRGPGQTLERQTCEEIYVRFVFKYSSNWDFHSGGEKLFVGNDGSLPSMAIELRHGAVFVALTIDGYPTSRRFWLPLKATAPVPNRPQEGLASNPNVARFERGQYHTVEFYRRKQTDSSDAGVRFWLDGVEYTRFSSVGAWDHPELWDIGLAAFKGRSTSDLSSRLECCMYWGGQNDVKQRDDWIRVSEIYVSGK